MKYEVTCPKCGRMMVTEWSDELAPGGIDPIECECGFLILSESEGNPSKIWSKKYRYINSKEREE